MAEFLIYDKYHWMDKLNQEEYDKLMEHPHGAEKFLFRYQKGDIVEVRPDGFFTSTLKGDLSRWPFRVIVVQGLNPNKMYVESTPTKKRRFSISTGAAQKVTIVSSISDITIIDKNGRNCKIC